MSGAGGGHFAAEEGIVLVVDHVHIAAAGHQDGPQAALADAVHGVYRNAQPGGFDLLHIQELQDAVDILVEGVDLPDLPLLQRHIVVHLGDGCGDDLGDLRLDLIGHRLVRVPAPGR